MLSLDLSANNDADADSRRCQFHSARRRRDSHFPVAPYNRDAVYLQGHVLRRALFPKSGMTLRDVMQPIRTCCGPAAAEIIRLKGPDFPGRGYLAARWTKSASPARPARHRAFQPATLNLAKVWVGGEVHAR
jgi:hypothetical protein